MPKFTIHKTSEIDRKETYPFSKLKIGQGFSVGGFELERSIRAQASKQKQKGKEFTVAKTKEGIAVKRLK